MRNSFIDYKKLLSTFTYEEKVNELNRKKYEILSEKHDGNMVDTRYDLVKELQHMRNNIINKL